MPHSLLEPVFEILCFGAGAVIIKICSFGKIGFYDSFDEAKKKQKSFFKKGDNGKILIPSECATLTGIIFWVFMAYFLYCFWPLL
jgi:hypothetical protein